MGSAPCSTSCSPASCSAGAVSSRRSDWPRNCRQDDRHDRRRPFLGSRLAPRGGSLGGDACRSRGCAPRRRFGPRACRHGIVGGRSRPRRVASPAPPVRKPPGVSTTPSRRTPRSKPPRPSRPNASCVLAPNGRTPWPLPSRSRARGGERSRTRPPRERGSPGLKVPRWKRSPWQKRRPEHVGPRRTRPLARRPWQRTWAFEVRGCKSAWPC